MNLRGQIRVTQRVGSREKGKLGPGKKEGKLGLGKVGVTRARQKGKGDVRVRKASGTRDKPYPRYGLGRREGLCLPHR